MMPQSPAPGDCVRPGAGLFQGSPPKDPREGPHQNGGVWCHNAAMRSQCVKATIVLFLTAGSASASEVRPIAEVTALLRDLQGRQPEVTLRGAVIGADRAQQELFVEDASGGIRIEVSAARTVDSAGREAATIGVGDEIEVSGTIEPGAFAPSLRAARIVRHSQQPLPPPRRCATDAFFAGGEDCRLVEIEGVVQQVWHEAGSLCLEIEASSRLLTAEIPASVVDLVWPSIGHDPQALVDATVRVAGPAVSVVNTRGEILRPWVKVDRAEWFTVISSAMTFMKSAVPLESIAGFRPVGEQGHRVQTFGTVIHAIPGRVLFLQNGHRGVMVRLGAEAEGTLERFSPGDLVEVAGFVDRSGQMASIRGAAARKVSHSGPPTPLGVLPDAILRINAAAVRGQPLSAPGDYEGCLVSFRGHLMQSQPTADGGVLVLRSAGVIVNAEASAEAFQSLETTELGSFVAVTGVASIDWDTPPQQGSGATPQRLRIVLRSAEDVRVVKTPPWWTTARLATVLVASGTILAMALAWVGVLRRQLAVQSRLLAAEMRSRRDAAVEFEATLRERNRLAANLHDTLQQTIGGIGFQLDACLAAGGGAGDETKRHIDVARRMVGYAATEVQGTVWAMRSLLLAGKTLETAFKDMVDRIGEGRGARISVAVDGAFDDLPEFVAGNLLLIAQEALHNALRHGKPTVLGVTVGTDGDDGVIHLRVEDDGRGFVVGKQLGASEGHFGIQGMRERAERLGGRLAITSRPGGGTIVEATVLRRDYDAHLDGDV